MSTSKKSGKRPKSGGPAKNQAAKKPANRKRRVRPLAVILPTVGVVVAIIGVLVAVNWKPFKQLADDRKTVAVCNGYEIPYEELLFVTTFYKNRLAEVHGEDIWDDPATAETYREELETLVKENLSNNYVVLSACEQLGIDTKDSIIDNYVDTQIDLIQEEIGSNKEYKAFLREQGLTEHYFRFAIGISYMENALHLTMLDQDLYEYRYEDNAADFIRYVMDSGKYIRTKQIYIENQEGEDPAENLKRAEAISKELKAAATIEERRALLSDYIGSPINDDHHDVAGYGYYFSRGEMDETYENAAFELEIGEVSDPVVCSGGNFIIMRFELEETYVKDNVKDLIDSYHGVCENEYIEKFRPNCEVFYTEYGKTIDLLTISIDN